jgi:hypothetical protein
MGGACSAHGEMRMRTKVWLEILKVRDNSKDLGVNAKIVLKLILGK